MNPAIPALEKNCPVCHVQVRPTDYFCFNCGKSLKEKLKSISLSSQIGLYLGSLVLPPMGIIWGLRYLKQPDQKRRWVGIVAIVLTLISLAVSIVWMVNLVNEVNRQVEDQMSTIGF